MIHIVIADDHAILRNGLKLILDQMDEFEVVGCASNGIEAVALAKEHKPDVVLMDICMDGGDGIEATRQIKHYSKDIKVLCLTTFDDMQFIIDLIAAGVDGYILKAMPDDELVAAIKNVYNGMAVFDQRIKQNLQQYAFTQELAQRFTPRESGIIRLIVQGKTNKQIAQEIGLKEGTVKNVITVIFDKAGVADRAQLSEFVNQNGLLEKWKSAQ